MACQHQNLFQLTHKFNFSDLGSFLNYLYSNKLYIPYSKVDHQFKTIQCNYTGELGYDGLNRTRKIGEYLICIGLGPSISSVICKNMSYSGPSYLSSPVVTDTSMVNKLHASIQASSCCHLLYTRTSLHLFSFNTYISFLF